MSFTSVPSYMLSSSLLENKPGCNFLLEASKRKLMAPASNKGSLQNKYVTIESELTRSSNKMLEKQPSVSIAVTNTSQLLQSKHSDRLTSHQQLVNSLLVKCQPALSVNPLLVNVGARAPYLQGTNSSAHASIQVSKQLDSPSNACLISEAARIENERTEPLCSVKSAAAGVKCDNTWLNKKVKSTKEKKHTKAKSEGEVKHKVPPISTHNEKQLSVTEKEFCKPNYKLPEDNQDMHARPFFATVDDFQWKYRATEVSSVKKAFVNIVSASLIFTTNFKLADDPFRVDVINLADQLSSSDPEFILKVALYTRRELNIRTAANFLLSYASKSVSCRPFLAKYFVETIRLPSDWIEVAEQYQVFCGASSSSKSIPAALRRAMVKKFQDFDQYQLAKYNKESSLKKKKKTKKRETSNPSVRGRKRGRDNRPRNVVAETVHDITRKVEASNTDELNMTKFTLKQLIRKLHIVEPVDNVMCLIGKRYPATMELFYQSRLPGTFEEAKAGKRMKLPMPETWETQVSLKGNKASTWEGLIDHKKLPFMAMLRNIRNMIKAGISEKHHSWVLHKLSNKDSVINSKQFPFRFFSAFQVLDELEALFNGNQQAIIDEAVGMTSNKNQHLYVKKSRGGRGSAVNMSRGNRGRGRGKGRGASQSQRNNGRKKKDKEVREVLYDPRLLDRYRKALDKAVQFSTTHNVKPIMGTSIILCDMRLGMHRPCTSAKGLGKPRTVAEIAALLGLMCKYSCEESQLIVFGHSDIRHVELEKGTILNNMDSVLKLSTILNSSNRSSGIENVEKLLFNLLIDRIQVNNIIILTDGAGIDSDMSVMLTSFREKYRRFVNSHLLFVNIDLGGSASRFTSQCDNDVFIAGFSDQILRFIAERGESSQLVHVEKIDEAYNLKSSSQLSTRLRVGKAATTYAPEVPLSVVSSSPRWRSCRIFISSTFRDMHAERDLLTRFVFPELRARAEKLYVTIQDVDLRWGVTERETQTEKSIEICLSEVSKSQLFIGILGERYGWIPEKYEISPSSDFDWVCDYQQGASVTELEMYQGALAKPGQMQDKAFFYFRDSSFMRDVPKNLLAEFEVENMESAAKMAKLKNKILSTGLECFKGYPCGWGGLVDGKPYVDGLNLFAERVLNNVWNAVHKLYPPEGSFLDELSHEFSLHKYFIASQQDGFVGRKALMKQCMNVIHKCQTGVVTVTGVAGSGKSALMASLVKYSVQTKMVHSEADVFIHFIGVSSASYNIVAMLRRFCFELRLRFHLPAVDIDAEDYKGLVVNFSELLILCGKQIAPTNLAFFIDGLDMFSDTHHPQAMQWLPYVMPKNVLFILSMSHDSNCLQVLQGRWKSLDTVSVGTLDVLDKEDIVRTKLAAYAKKLDDSPFNSQMKLLLSKKDAALPLYLSLACNELRIFGIFEKVTAHVKSLPQTVSQLIQFTLHRLESDIGLELVAIALSLLVVSRSGLSESELHCLLSLNNVLRNLKVTVDVVRSACLGPDNMIPQLLMMKLIRALHCFLQPLASNSVGPTILNVSHTQIRNLLRQRYIKTGICDEQKMHTLLAGYYFMSADPLRNNSWIGNNERALLDLPFHIAACNGYQDLCSILCDLQFIRKKCVSGLGMSLLDDFVMQGTMAVKIKGKLHERILEYESFVSRNIHILSSYGILTCQQALNQPDYTWPAKDARRLNGQSELAAEQPSLIEWINKPQKMDLCIRTLTYLPDAALSLKMSHKNQVMAVGFADCSARTYDFHSGKELMSFYGHSDQVTSVCFVGTSRLCTASADNTLSLWDLFVGNRLAVLRGHSRRVNDCVSDDSGKLIVSVGWDCNIKLWNGITGQSQDELPSEQRPLNCIAMHCDNQLVAVGCWDATVRLYDIFNKQRKAIWRGHSSSVRDVAFSLSGRHVASASIDGKVHIWFTATGSNIGAVCGHSQPVNGLLFTPKGNELITGSDDHKLKVWSGDLGVPITQFGNKDYGTVRSVAFDALGQHVAAGYHNGCVRLLEINTGLIKWVTAELAVPVSINCLQFSKELTKLLVGAANGLAMILNGATGLVEQTFQAHSKSIMSVAYGSQLIVTTSEDFEVHLYSTHKSCDSKDFVLLSGHSGPVTCCSFNSDESRLATGSRDKSIIIWNVVNMSSSVNIERVLTNCHADWINCCDWSNTGDFLVTGSSDFNLKLWDVSSGTEKRCLTGHASAVTGVSYQYGCIVSSSRDGTVKVWSHHGVEITTLRGHVGSANSCHLNIKIKPVLEDAAVTLDDWATVMDDEEWRQKHADTRLNKQNTRIESVMVASCSDDGTLRLWLPTLSHELSCLTGHTDRVISLSCSEDGIVCSGSLDRQVKFWKLDAGNDDEAQMYWHNDEVTWVVTSSDSSIIASASRDGMLKIWQCKLVKNSNECSWFCSHVVKAHSKAVNCVTFFGDDNSLMLVTGSDDSTIAIWKIMVYNENVKVRQVSVHEADSPITSVVCVPSGEESLILAFQWKPTICMWRVNQQGHAKLVDKVASQQAWIQCSSCIFSSGQSFIVLGGNDYVVNVWNFDINETKCTLVKSIRLFHQVWVTCIASSDTTIYIGDSSGQLICSTIDNGMDKSRKAHSDRITSVMVRKNHVFTSSLDSTIKLWNMNLEQVGLYFCSSPVLTMSICHREFDQQLLVCGTALGQLLFLALTPETRLKE